MAFWHPGEGDKQTGPPPSRLLCSVAIVVPVPKGEAHARVTGDHDTSSGSEGSDVSFCFNREKRDLGLVMS